MNNRKAYIKPAIEVIHMMVEGYFCAGTVFKLETLDEYRPQHDPTSGTTTGVQRITSSFGEDYGLFGSSTNSAKALGAPFEDEADSTFEP